MKTLLIGLVATCSLQAGEFVQKQKGVDAHGQPVYTWVYQADKKFRRERGVAILSSGYGSGYGYEGGIYAGYPYSFPLLPSRPWIGPSFHFLPGPCAAPAWLGPIVLRYSRGR